MNRSTEPNIRHAGNGASAGQLKKKKRFRSNEGTHPSTFFTRIERNKRRARELFVTLIFGNASKRRNSIGAAQKLDFGDETAPPRPLERRK